MIRHESDTELAPGNSRLACGSHRCAAAWRRRHCNSWISMERSSASPRGQSWRQRTIASRSHAGRVERRCVRWRRVEQASGGDAEPVEGEEPRRFQDAHGELGYRRARSMGSSLSEVVADGRRRPRGGVLRRPRRCLGGACGAQGKHEVSIWRLSSADHDDLVLVRRGWEACVELRVDDRQSAAEPGGGRGSLEQVARDDLLNNSGGEVRA